MRIALTAAMLVLLALAAPAESGKLRILDASWSGIPALRGEAFRFGLAHHAEVAVNRLNPDWALEKLAAGDADLLLLEQKDLPEKSPLHRRWIAAEALVFYVHVKNPLRCVTVPQLRKLLTAAAPAWQECGGSAAQIHRYRLKPEAFGRGLAERLLKEPHLSAGFFTVNSTEEALMLLGIDPEGLVAGRFLPEISDQVVALAVEGVSPTITSVSDASYPLTHQYLLVWKDSPGALAEAFLKQLDGNAFYESLLDDGLLPRAGGAPGR